MLFFLLYDYVNVNSIVIYFITTSSSGTPRILFATKCIIMKMNACCVVLQYCTLQERPFDMFVAVESVTYTFIWLFGDAYTT